MRRACRRYLASWCLLPLSAAGPAVLAADLSSIALLPGDAQVELAPETQEWPQIAAGGPGYLAVWQDMRPVLSGTTNTPDLPLTGNDWDIYAALLDAEGNVLESPILVSNEGKNGTRPRVAWNGESWLVVWTRQRPDWYFFEDLVGARVSTDGELLDPQPIGIRMENNVPANDRGENPAVGSDGTNWVVVWEDVTHELFNDRLNLSGARIAPDGTVLDPEPVLLYQFDDIVFGPEDPRIVWAGDEYLLVWENFGDVLVQRFDAALSPLDPAPVLVTTTGSNPRPATDGTDFLIVTAEYRAYRVTHGGVPLDGNNGIPFDPGGTGFQPDGPNVAWTGFQYAVTFGNSAGIFDDSEVFLVLLEPDGSILPPGPFVVHGSPEADWEPAIASPGDGSAQIVWAQGQPEDIRSLHLDAAGVPGPDGDVGVGLHRQAYVRFASNGDEHLAVYVSDGGGAQRLLAQRLDPAGAALDPEPTVLTVREELSFTRPDVAFNGSHYLVTWTDEVGSVLAQRLDAAGSLIDPAPVTLVFQDAAGEIGVGALGGNFLIAYTHTFSGDQQYLKAARVADDLTLLDTPSFIGFDFALGPRVAPLGDGWVVVWEDQVNHDQSTSDIAGVLVGADGLAAGSFAVNTTGNGDGPDVAASGDRAFVVWHDNADFGDSKVKGRILLDGGAFQGGELLIADAANDQVFTRSGWDGENFVAAWVDFRTVEGIEQKRGDVWAARVGVDGALMDPAGIQMTEGSLPEDLPEIAGSGGRAVIAFSMLAGESEPEIQRIATRSLGAGFGLTAGGECPGVVTVEVSGATPGARLLLAASTAVGSAAVPRGACEGSALGLENPRLVATLTADAGGAASVSASLAGGICGAFLQALDESTCGTSEVGSIPLIRCGEGPLSALD